MRFGCENAHNAERVFDCGPFIDAELAIVKPVRHYLLCCPDLCREGCRRSAKDILYGLLPAIVTVILQMLVLSLTHLHPLLATAAIRPVRDSSRQ